jgi:hypothetical protein
VLAPFAPFAVSDTVPPLQIYPLFVGPAVGAEFTVTVVVYIVDGVQPDAAVPFVTVNEYVLLTVGVAVGF